MTCPVFGARSTRQARPAGRRWRKSGAVREPVSGREAGDALAGRVFEMQRRAGMDAAMDRMRGRRGLGEARQELRSEICPENRG